MDLNNTESTQPSFRQEATAHLHQETEGVGILYVSPPWTWTIMLVLTVFVLAGLLIAVAGRVEVHERGKGILKPLSGIRYLQAQAPGTVAELMVQPGKHVEPGEACLRLEAPSLRGSILQAEDELKRYGAEYQDLDRRQEALHRNIHHNLEARVRQLEADESGQRRSVDRCRRKLNAVQTLTDLGIVGKLEREDALEQVDKAELQLRAVEESLRQTRQEREATEASFRKDVWNRRNEPARALSRRMALEFDLDNQVITSQVAGFVDSLLVRCGDNVQAGQVVIRIVPKEVELRVVAFLSEAHRAWVNEGDRVKLELSQFPYAEFGTLDGKVISMGMDFASPGEVAIALGEGTRLDGPVFKVELEVLPRKDGPLAKVALKPGMLVDARFTLRRQSPISLVLKPLAQWLR